MWRSDAQRQLARVLTERAGVWQALHKMRDLGATPAAIAGVQALLNDLSAQADELQDLVDLQARMKAGQDE